MDELTRQQRVEQCRKPVGKIGKSVGAEMNEHHRDLWEWGLSHVEIARDASILDIGCGGGKSLQVLAQLAPQGKVTGIDYSADMVEMSADLNRDLIEAGRVCVSRGNVEKLDFADETFDQAVAFETYYFWPDQQANLAEICRVLKPGGKILLVNEVFDHPDFAERNRYYVETAKMSIHTEAGFRELLESAGYEVLAVDPIVEKNWITVLAQKPV